MSNQIAQLERALEISNKNLSFALDHESLEGIQPFVKDVEELQTKIQTIRSQMGQ
jgi:hypothetical protein